MFLHDSLHTYDYESKELAAVEPNLTADAIILSDNAHDSRGAVGLGGANRPPLPVLQGAARQPLVARRRHRGRVGKVMYHRGGTAALVDMPVLRRS